MHRLKVLFLIFWDLDKGQFETPSMSKKICGALLRHHKSTSCQYLNCKCVTLAIFPTTNIVPKLDGQMPAQHITLKHLLSYLEVNNYTLCFQTTYMLENTKYELSFVVFWVWTARCLEFH